MDVFVGLDVSLASTAICVLGEKGKIVTEAQVASAPESLVAFMRKLPHGIAAIGLEARSRCLIGCIMDLSDAGFETVLMETPQVKAALKAMPIKTDRRDAEGIARLLQMGWFRPVHCKSVSSKEMRALLTSRKSVQDALTNLELSLRGVLRNFGLKLGQGLQGPLRGPCPGFDRRQRDAGGRGRTDPARAGGPAPRAGRPGEAGPQSGQAGPGVPATDDHAGRRRGHSLDLHIRDRRPGAFRRSKDVGPWVGLTPGRDQFGERDIVGRITKAGDAGLRAALYQAATVMLNHAGPNWLKAWAQRLTKLRGKKRATVALARRIGVVLHRMWRDGTEFRFTREEAMALRTA